jgi:hypothetical protein
VTVPGAAADQAQRIAVVRRQLDDLRCSLPKHSVSMAMALRLEALEEELARLEALAAKVEGK